jgi:hypothetical protein
LKGLSNILVILDLVAGLYDEAIPKQQVLNACYLEPHRPIISANKSGLSLLLLAMR